MRMPLMASFSLPCLSLATLSACRKHSAATGSTTETILASAAPLTLNCYGASCRVLWPEWITCGEFWSPWHRRRDLARAEDTHFYLERSCYLAVAEGRPVPIGNLARLVQRVWENDESMKTRAALVAFLILTAILPNRRAQQGLSYRLNTNQRSMTGLLRSLL